MRRAISGPITCCPELLIQILRSAVFWPRNDDPLFRLVGVFNPSFLGGFPTSDHRLVWADLRIPGASE